MKIKEVSDKYNVAMSTLRYYEKVGLFNDVLRIHGIREYDDKDIQRLSLILSLKNMGFNIQGISRYIELEQLGEKTKNQRIQMLKCERVKLLDDIHKQQKCLDTLDCFLYQLKGCCEKNAK